MGKKNKRKSAEFENDVYEFDGVTEHEQDSPVPYPMQFTQEYLASMDDDSLYNTVRSLQESINKVGRLNLNPYPWEIELCYLQQETQVRAVRRAKHAEWVSSLPPSESE